MKDQGFTLIEVLAALMVFSLAIIGLSHAGTESARAVSVLQDKMIGGIIADNQLIEVRQDDLKLGVVRGEVTMMSAQFRYEVETSETEVEGFYRLTARIRKLDADHVIIERSAFRRE